MYPFRNLMKGINPVPGMAAKPSRDQRTPSQIINVSTLSENGSIHRRVIFMRLSKLTNHEPV